MADDVATLGFQVDSTQVQSASRALHELTESTKQLSTVMVDSLNKIKATASAHRDAAEAAKRNADAQGLLGATMKSINLQLVALSAGAGPVGTFLSSLGPWGFAAAVGLGALEKIFTQLSEDAKMMGEKAGGLRRFAEETEFTYQEIAALKRVFAEFHLTSEEAETRILRLAVSLNAARDGSGELLERTRAISPELALEYRSMTTLAQGVDIFSRALNGSSDALSRAKLAQAALGRGGQAAVPAFGALDQRGGLENMAKDIEAVGLKSKDTVDELANLNARLTYLHKQIENTRALIYAKEVLRFQVDMAERELEIAKRVAEAAEETKKRSFWQNILYQLTMSVVGEDLQLLETVREQNTELEKQNKQREEAKRIAEEASKIPLPRPRPAEADNPPSPISNPVFDAAAWKTFLGVLGNAATAEEKYQGKIAEIAAAQKKQEFAALGAAKGQEAVNRALAGAEYERRTNEVNDYITRLGAAATETDKFKQSVTRYQSEAAGRQATPEQIDAGTQRMNQQEAIKLEEARINALGTAATRTEKYNLGVMKLKESLADETITTETATRAQENLTREMNLDKQREAVAALGDAATETEKYALAVAELQKKLDNSAISQNVFNRAVLNANPVFKQLKESSDQFFSSFLNDLAQGNSMAQALSGSLKSVGSSLINAGVKNIINDPSNPTGYVEAGIGFVAQMFGSKSAKQQQQEQQNLQDTQKAAQEAQQRQLQNQIAIFNAQQDYAIAALGTINNFQQALTKQAIEENKARVDALMEGSTDLSALEQQFATQRLQIQQEYQRRALERQKTYEDRMFAATTDTSTLAGQLATFDRQVEKDRQAEAQAGGEAMATLEQTQALERLKIIKDYNDQLIEEQKRVFKSISEYLQNLQFGGLSILSPQAQLEAAQQAFQTQLGLAQGGDQDALSGITKTADQLLNIAKSFYASGVNYANIYGQVTGSLGGLLGTSSGTTLQTATGSLTGATAATSSALGFAATGGTGITPEDARKNFTDLAATLVDVGKDISDHIDELKEAYLQVAAQEEAYIRLSSNRVPLPGSSLAA